MIYAIVVICGVLLALQFPVVISSPVAALAFAFLTTASLGTVATIVGGTFAPLSMFALILVSLNVRFDFNCLVFMQRLNAHTKPTILIILSKTQRFHLKNQFSNNYEIFYCIYANDLKAMV